MNINISAYFFYSAVLVLITTVLLVILKLTGRRISVMKIILNVIIVYSFNVIGLLFTAYAVASGKQPTDENARQT